MTTNPNYYYAPSTIKNLLDKSIYSVTDVINWYTKSLDVDFTRIRKITVDTLIKFILLMSTDKSINSSLSITGDIEGISLHITNNLLLFIFIRVVHSGLPFVIQNGDNHGICKKRHGRRNLRFCKCYYIC